MINATINLAALLADLQATKETVVGQLDPEMTVESSDASMTLLQALDDLRGHCALVARDAAAAAALVDIKIDRIRDTIMMPITTDYQTLDGICSRKTKAKSKIVADDSDLDLEYEG